MRRCAATTETIIAEVVWTPEAIEDRRAIFAHIAEIDIDAARRLDRAFDAATARLATFPQSGRRGELAGTREVNPHRNYRLVYRAIGDSIVILMVVHAARRWPPE